MTLFLVLEKLEYHNPLLWLYGTHFWKIDAYLYQIKLQQTLSQLFGELTSQPTGHPLTQQLPYSIPSLTEQLWTSLFSFTKNSRLVYFPVEKGFGCYQLVARQDRARVWLVNRQLAALQGSACSRAEQRRAVTLIPPLSLPDGPL